MGGATAVYSWKRRFLAPEVSILGMGSRGNPIRKGSSSGSRSESFSVNHPVNVASRPSGSLPKASSKQKKVHSLLAQIRSKPEGSMLIFQAKLIALRVLQDKGLIKTDETSIQVALSRFEEVLQSCPTVPSTGRKMGAGSS